MDCRFTNWAQFPCREGGVPDVSYSAAVGHSVLTYLDIPGIPPGFYGFGGTSAGSPQWAAIVAIADQKAKRGLGFINSTLYLFSLLPKNYSAMFHDVTKGNNSVVEQDVNNKEVKVHGFNAENKWDATTGLGSPKADQLVNFLISFPSDSDANQAMNNSNPGPSHRSGHHKVRNHWPVLGYTKRSRNHHGQQLRTSRATGCPVFCW